MRHRQGFERRPHGSPHRGLADIELAQGPATQSLPALGGLASAAKSTTAAIDAAKGSAGGRPPTVDAEVYRQRNVVERYFNRLKQWRDLATRYAKRASIYRASIVLIAALIWLT